MNKKVEKIPKTQERHETHRQQKRLKMKIPEVSDPFRVNPSG